MWTARVSVLAGTCLVAWTLAEAAPAGGGPQPDLELLEFLGDWQTEDGKAVDPFALDDMPIPEETPEGRKMQDGRDKERGDSTKNRPVKLPSASTRDREPVGGRADERYAR